MGAFDVFLVHTYTRVSKTAHVAANVNDPTEDAEGGTIYDPATAVSGLPCWLRPRSRVRINEQGVAEVDPAALYVLPDDPIKEGDAVTNVLSEEGELIFEGPLVAQMTSPRTLDRGVEVKQVDVLGAQVTF